MTDYTTSGAISGAGSGASAGAATGNPWAIAGGAVLGGVMGAMGGGAAGHAAARAKRLRNLRQGAQHHVATLEEQANAEAQKRLQQITAQRYASYGQLANQLGSPERAAAGDAAGVDAKARLGGALGAVNAAPVGDRSLVGGGANTAAIEAQLSPVLAARRAAMVANRTQGGLETYDQGALNAAHDTSLDLSRQAQESQQQQGLLAEIRRRMLAQAGVRFHDSGPTSGETNAMMMSQLGLAGLHAAGGAYGVSQQNALADAARAKVGAVPNQAFNQDAAYFTNNPFGSNPPVYTYKVN